MMQEIVQAASTTKPSEVVPYFSSALVILKAQQTLKGTEKYQAFVKAFPGADKWAHVLVAAVGSLVAALGIGYVFDYDPTKGGVLTLQIPALAILLHRGWDFVVVYLFQDYGYMATRRGPMAPPPEIVKAEEVKHEHEGDA